MLFNSYWDWAISVGGARSSLENREYLISTVQCWLVTCKRGRDSKMNIQWVHQLRCLSPEMVKNHNMLLDDRHLKVRELVEVISISKSYLLTKLSPKLVLSLITLEEMQCREDVSVECLAKFEQNKEKSSPRVRFGSVILYLRQGNSQNIRLL